MTHAPRIRRRRKRCLCGNTFTPSRMRVIKPRTGTRCGVCCCHRLAIIEHVWGPGDSTIALCARCLAAELERLFTVDANARASGCQ